MEPNSLRRGRREASFGAEPRTLATTTSKPSAPVSDSVREAVPFAAVRAVRDHHALTDSALRSRSRRPAANRSGGRLAAPSVRYAAARDRARSARNSDSVFVPFFRLHDKHAGRMLSIELEPPRDNGIR